VFGRRARDEDPDEVHDIVTPTEREALERSIAARRRRYFIVMVPCIVLVLFGFFVPAPVPVRVAALAVACVLPPIASILGNS
jgi:Na+/H+ antiporter NhaD/arsenite permease-like protein